jgi:hypothetical protein
MEQADRGDIFIRNVLAFSGLYGVTSQQKQLFITTAVRNSNPT